MAAIVARWIESLQLLNDALQKDEQREVSKLKKALILTPRPLKQVKKSYDNLHLLNEALQEKYNQDSMIGEHREVSKLNKVCDAHGDFVEDNFDLDYDLEMGRNMKEREHMFQKFYAYVDEL